VQKKHSTYLKANTKDANECNDDFDENAENRDETTNSERQQQNDDTRKMILMMWTIIPKFFFLEQRLAQLQQLVCNPLSTKYADRNVGAFFAIQPANPTVYSSAPPMVAVECN
jgi:hypothetical protein